MNFINKKTNVFLEFHDNCYKLQFRLNIISTNNIYNFNIGINKNMHANTNDIIEIVKDINNTIIYYLNGEKVAQNAKLMNNVN